MSTDIKTLLIQELPDLLEKDPTIRESVWRLIMPYFAPREQTESRFDAMMAEIRQMREESERKWQENQARWERNQEELRQMREESERKWQESKEELRQMREESERKWQESKKESERKWQEGQEELRQMREESERKWQENQARWERNQEELRQMREESERKWQESKKESERKWQESKEESDRKWQLLDKKIESKFGAIGARWGISSETAFRNALRGILEEVADVQVLNVNEYDDEGEVFGRPDQVELDIIIHNGTLMVCELKSSISKADVAVFERKAQFYEKRHQRKVSHKVIISPMVDARALPLAQKLGIRVYHDAEDVFAEDT
jgi:hypothetical protein